MLSFVLLRLGRLLVRRLCELVRLDEGARIVQGLGGERGDVNGAVHLVRVRGVVGMRWCALRCS